VTSSDEGVDPFRVAVEESVLLDLGERLARARIPDQIDGTGWEYGFPADYLADLLGYWRDGYDWRREEGNLNALSQFRTSIDDQVFHFVHVRSSEPAALPLLLVHGWPGSIVEFLDVIPRLVDPVAFGGTATDAFDVVVPSLPGYGFSEPPRTRGWNEGRIAEAFATLMARIGYSSYGAQGGDWGAQVTTRLAALDAGHCVGLHVNMALGVRPDSEESLSQQEQADLMAMKRFGDEESGYAHEQGTKPQTIGAALNDSPVGLLAWIGEKFRSWTDCHDDLESCVSRDRLLTNVMIYWVTQTAASSARLYWESRHTRGPERALPFVEVPTGVARYPKEVLRWPRSWVERQYNVVHWAEMDRGGHFPAMEQPEMFVDDLRSFFRRFR
jgi:epoxide hydrolase